MTQTSSRREALASVPSRAMERLVQYGVRQPRWLAALVLGALLVSTWLVVDASGGTHSGTPQLFYISIALAAAPFGFRGTLITALIAAALCAQAPMNVATGQSQTVTSISIRTAMYVMVALVTAGVVSVHRRADTRSHFRELSELISPVAARSVPADQTLVPLVADVLEQGAWHAVFQPVYSLHTGDLLSVEALTRFHPEPYRSPDKWFAAAEQTGLGIDLELAAIQTALGASGSLSQTTRLSVNASPGTLEDPRFLELVLAATRPLIVELTEHAVINNYHLLEEPLGRLRRAGVLIAVDEAGAGFASLQHIVELNPDIIKLDISLTQNITTSPTRAALGGALIDFVHRTGTTMVVEGIEDQADLTMWVQLGADAVQGYLVGRPGTLPVESVSPAVLHARQAVTVATG